MQSDPRGQPALQLTLGALLFAFLCLSPCPGQGASTYFIAPGLTNGQNVGFFSALQSDGKILINNATARLNTDGTPDTTYSLDLRVQTGVNAQVGVTPSGMIVISDSGGLTTCNSNGSLAQVIFAPQSGITNFLVQPDGKLIIWASGTITIDGISRPVIARINTDGSLDTTFDPGYGPDSGITAVAVQTDGKIIVGGYFSNFDKIAAPHLVRLNTTGTVDTSFSEAALPNITPGAIVELQSGKVLACDAGGRGVWIINSDGSGGTQVGNISGGPEDFNAIALQADGKVVLGGQFSSYGPNAVSGLIRLNTDGSLDPTFNAGPVLGNLGYNGITGLALDTAGHVYFSGFNSSENSYYSNTVTAGFVRLNSDGSQDLAFAPGTPCPGQVLANARSSDGRVFVAGTFLSVNGVARVGLASFNANGSLDTTFVPSAGIPWTGIGKANTLQQPAAQLFVLADGSVLLSGSFSALGTVGGAGVVHFLPNGTLDPAFNPTLNAGGTVSAAVGLPGGDWVMGGSFTTVDGSPRANIAGFTASGALDPSFAALSGTNAPVTLLAVRPSGGLYLAGSFSEVGTNRNDSVAALNADGTVDTTFSAPGIEAGTIVTALAPMGDGRLMVATGTSSWGLLRLTSTGATYLTFAYPTTGLTNFYAAIVSALAVDESARPIVGVTQVIQGAANRPGGIPPPATITTFIDRFDSLGNLDPTFVASRQLSNAPISSLTIGSDGLLVAGGSFAGATPANAFTSPVLPLSVFDGSAVSGLILVPQATESVTVAPALSVQPAALAASAGSPVSFGVTAAGVGLSYLWNLNGVPIAGATGTTLSIADAGLPNVGTYTVTVSNSAGSVTSSPAPLSLTGPPQIVAQPSNTGSFAGGTTSVTVTATGSAPLTYQWSFGGAAIEGATGATLTLADIATSQTGTYTVTISNAQGSVTSDPATVTVTANANTARLENISARAYVAPGQGAADILIVGFVTSGENQKQILVRGIGPTLASFDVSGFLADPELTLFSGQTSLATTSNWNSSLAATFTSVGAFALLPGSNDTALLQGLPPGAYTAQITSTNSANGIALAEVYDADWTSTQSGNPGTRLVNISARAWVGTGANILIGGFVVAGTSSKTVLIRAVGPALTQLGVSGALSTPILTVYDSASPANVIATNAGWQNAPVQGPSPVVSGLQPATAAVMSSVGAFGLAAGSTDSAMILTLPAGAYTAQVSGANNTTGIALVEIYEIP